MSRSAASSTKESHFYRQCVLDLQRCGESLAQCHFHERSALVASLLRRIASRVEDDARRRHEGKHQWQKKSVKIMQM